MFVANKTSVTAPGPYVGAPHFLTRFRSVCWPTSEQAFNPPLQPQTPWHLPRPIMAECVRNGRYRLSLHATGMRLQGPQFGCCLPETCLAHFWPTSITRPPHPHSHTQPSHDTGIWSPLIPTEVKGCGAGWGVTSLRFGAKSQTWAANLGMPKIPG